ncbi:hypothetical protein ACO1LA_14255, partial [Staphylococcus aureus]
MMKFSPRLGARLSCGWPPPAGPIATPAIAPPPGVDPYRVVLAGVASQLPLTPVPGVAAAEEAVSAWLCGGI